MKIALSSLACRGSGVGTALVERCIAELTALEILKCNVFVFSENVDGVYFWANRGFVLRNDLSLLQRRVHP